MVQHTSAREFVHAYVQECREEIMVLGWDKAEEFLSVLRWVREAEVSG